jgi:hypothetical protein
MQVRFHQRLRDLGEIESKVNDGETRIDTAGESWSEPPNSTHLISGNASKTKPPKLSRNLRRRLQRQGAHHLGEVGPNRSEL